MYRRGKSILALMYQRHRDLWFVLLFQFWVLPDPVPRFSLHSVRQP